MSISLKPRSPLKLPTENPLITALKKRLSEFRTELSAMFSLFDSRFRTEKQRIDAKLKEADRILQDAKKVKDGKTPTEEELTELIQRYIPEVEDGHTPTDEELTALILANMPEVKDGHTPTEQELLKIIQPLIPQVKDGHTPTERELLKLIKPLIPQPIQGDPGINGTEIKPEEVKEKLKELPVREAWFSVDHILGFTDKVRNLVSGLQGAKTGGMRGGGTSVRAVDLTSQCDGSNKTFSIGEPYAFIISLQGMQFPIVYRKTIDYTEVAGSSTITLTDEIGAPQTGQTLHCVYAQG